MSKLSLQDLSPETLELLRRHNLLKSLARFETIEEAISSEEINKEEADKLWGNYLKKFNIEDDIHLENHLQNMGLDKESLKWQLGLNLRVNQYSRKHFKHKAEARFLAKKDSLDTVIYSLLRTRDGFLARELYLRIASGEANFADLAAQHSQGNESRTNGIVGPAPLNQAHPILAERLRTSQPGQLQEPFSIDEWWLVLRLERYEPARLEESTRQTMTTELFQEWVEGEVLCKLAELKNSGASTPS